MKKYLKSIALAYIIYFILEFIVFGIISLISPHFHKITSALFPSLDLTLVNFRTYAIPFLFFKQVINPLIFAAVLTKNYRNTPIIYKAIIFTTSIPVFWFTSILAYHILFPFIGEIQFSFTGMEDVSSFLFFPTHFTIITLGYLPFFVVKKSQSSWKINFKVNIDN